MTVVKQIQNAELNENVARPRKQETKKALILYKIRAFRKKDSG
jgi:hypothetical protein